MKRFFTLLIISSFLIACVTQCSTAQKQQRGAERSSSAQAAYGTSAGAFKSHVKKNRKSKKSAMKAAKRKKIKKETPYRRGIPI